MDTNGNGLEAGWEPEGKATSGGNEVFPHAVFSGLVQLSEEPNPPPEMDLQIHLLHWKTSRIQGQGKNKPTQGIA